MHAGSESDDAAILAACLANDERAWGSFLERHAAFILAVIRSSARACGVSVSEQDSDDIMQEVLLALLRDDCRLLRGYRPEHPLRHWLAMIARARCLDALRRRGAAIRLETRLTAAGTAPGAAGTGSDEGPDALAEREELRQAVRHILAELPPKQRLMVTLFHVHGLKYREISVLTGAPEGTVAATISRSLRALRKLLPDSVKP